MDSCVENQKLGFCSNGWSKINHHAGTPYLLQKEWWIFPLSGCLTNNQYFTQLVYIIPIEFGTSSLKMLSSYQISILNIDNTFNNYWKCSSGLLILSSVWKIIPRKGNYLMSSIIFFLEFFTILTINLFLLKRTSLFSIQFLFVWCCVQVNFKLLN